MQHEYYIGLMVNRALPEYQRIMTRTIIDPFSGKWFVYKFLKD
jgi:hypothetical protein